MSMGWVLGIEVSDDEMTIDLAVLYADNDDFKIPKNTSKILNSSANGEGVVYNPYSGLDYEQKIVVPSININYKW